MNEPDFVVADGLSLTDAMDLSDAMVVKTVRVPKHVDRAIAAAAAEADMSPSAWIRAAIEARLAGREPANLVNVDDVLRAVSALPRATRYP